MKVYLVIELEEDEAPIIRKKRKVPEVLYVERTDAFVTEKSEEERLAIAREMNAIAKKEPQRYLDIDEAASILNVKRSFLYQQTYMKKIPHYKIGRYLRFRADELAEWAQTTKIEVRKEKAPWERYSPW